MKITLTLADGRELAAKLPHADAARVYVGELPKCPLCKETHPEGLPVAGKGNHTEGHDTFAARAHTLCCGGEIGILRAVVSTIFGIEEDRRVLNGRARVY